MKRKIYYFLIYLANKLTDGEFYDFGEPITGIVVYRDRLICATKKSMYRKNKTNDK